MLLGEIVSNTISFVRHNKALILTTVTVVGVGTTAFFTGKAVLEAEAYLRENVDEEILEVMPIRDKVKLTWNYYIPPAVSAAITITSAIYCQHINFIELTTLASLASRAEQKLIDNHEVIKELYGEKGLRKVSEGLNKKGLERYVNNRRPSNEYIYETGTGGMLCCDTEVTGLMWRCSPEWIDKGANRINAYLNEGEPKSYADLLYEWMPGFDPRQMPRKAERLGWNPSIEMQLVELNKDSFITSWGETCMTINLYGEPLEDYLLPF